MQVYILAVAAVLLSAPFVSAGDGGCPYHAHKKAIRVQGPAPEFTKSAVVDGSIVDLSLRDFAGKYLVIVFYPLDFTFVCPTEIIAFSDRIQEFQALNTEVIAVSTDSVYSHLAWTKKPRSEGGLGTVKIPLVSDFSKTMSADYGVLIPEEGVALRGLFIINNAGVVRQMTVNDLPVGRDVDETLRLIKAFQYTDTHGEVCPAGWKPGMDTIVPDPVKSQEFFSKQKDEM